MLCGRIVEREREREEDGKQRCREGSEMRPGFSLDPWSPASFPPSLILEWFQSPTRLPKSESPSVFATSFIVYRKQAKPLKLNRGSAGLYIQTPINTAVSPRDSPGSPFVKLAQLQLEMPGSWGRGREPCSSASQRPRVHPGAQPWGRPGRVAPHAALAFRVPKGREPLADPERAQGARGR